MSAQRRLWVSGFGAFPGVERNPSRELAFLLASQGLGPGWLDLCIDAAELPVVFAEVPGAIDRSLAALASPPQVLLGLGVRSAGHAFRLERLARGSFDSTRADNSGATGAGIDLGPTLRTDFDLAPLAAAMQAAGSGPVLLSDDAGRYVCERTYRHLLTRAEDLHARALFLHVPPFDVQPLDRQFQAVAALARALLPPDPLR